jgi:hypothetical protein
MRAACRPAAHNGAIGVGRNSGYASLHAASLHAAAIRTATLIADNRVLLAMGGVPGLRIGSCCRNNRKKRRYKYRYVFHTHPPSISSGTAERPVVPLFVHSRNEDACTRNPLALRVKPSGKLTE